MTLDTDFVRAQFPAFSEPSLSGQAFFENGGGSYACGPVIARLERFYRSRKVQPYAPYEASRLAGGEMDEARQRLAAMLNVESDEVSFGPSTTQNTYVLAQAFRQWMRPGEAIVVTDQDHEANSGPWRRPASRSANGGSTRKPGCCGWRIWKTCWMKTCVWSVFRIARTWWGRSIRWSRLPRHHMRQARLSALTECLMRRMDFRMWAGWGRISTCFPPTRPMARIRGSRSE